MLLLPQLVLVVLLVAAGSASPNSRHLQGDGMIDVYPTTPDDPEQNFTLNDALGSQAISNTILNLQPGVHRLTAFHLIADSSNVTLVGNGEVKITCSKDVGLAFVNISTLIFKNLTIERCGLSGSNLSYTAALIERNFFDVPAHAQVALFIGFSSNVELTSITISNTGGIGLLAMDPRGDSSINSSRFVSNLAAGCFARLTTGGTGGGVIFAYFESEENSFGNRLVIQNTTFENNSNCNPVSTLQWYAQYTSFLDNSSAMYTIGGGGGLTVYSSQYTSVSVEVQGCLFQNNTAQFGGGISINMFEGTSNLTVRISDTRFASNGAEDVRYAPGFTSNGAGIAILIGIQYLSNRPTERILSKLGNFLTIERCTFENSVAYTGGAVVLQSLYRTPSIPTTVLIDNCLFTNNRAYLGSVSVITELKSSAVQQGMQVIHRDCSFINNRIITDISGFLSNTEQSSSVVEVAATNMTFQGYSLFLDNYGTPIHGRTVIINVNGVMNFTGNTGSFGGGLSFESVSFLVLSNNSYLEFRDNKAYVGGGAIFVNVASSNTLRGLVFYDCFLFFERLEVGCVQYNNCANNLEDLNVTINIANNDAPLGEAVFGSTIETCEWLTFYQNQSRYEGHTNNGFNLLAAIGILHIDPPFNGSMNSISTPSVVIRPNSSDTNSTIISIMPGEVAQLNLTAEDRLNQSVPDPITSYVLDDEVNGVFTSILGSSGYWFLDRQARSNVPITVLSQYEPNSTNITVGMFSINSIAQITVTVIAEPCYPGFVFDNTTNRNHYGCKCNDVFDEFNGVRCNSDTGTITVPNGLWVGNVSDNNNEIVVDVCYPRYCLRGTRNIAKGDFNSQCVAHRVGILCGKCEENYSISFGDSATCQICYNTYLISLIFFALVGMSLMYTLGRMDITIKHGLMNCILFYSNILNVYRPFLIPQNLYAQYSSIVVPISWLNLTLGFPLCFYNGMDTLAATYLLFAFPAYVWFLMGITALGARYNRWPRFMARFRRNAVPLFSTLTLMTYVTTLLNCVQVFVGDTIEGVGLQWAIDPTVPYFDPARIPLMLIALGAIVFYIIPLPFLILFPSLTTKIWIGRKLLPIYDVFWAPFRHRMHFWVGMRLILRLVPIILAYVSDPPLNLLLLCIFLGVYLLAHLTFQPFKHASRNYLDTYLTINLLLITIGVLYFNVDSDGDKELSQLIYIIVFTVTAYLAFVAVYGYHFYITYLKDNKKFKKFEAACIAKLQKLKNKFHKFYPQMDKEYDSIEDSQVVVVASSRRLQGNGYREPLLGDSELSASTYIAPTDSQPLSINKDSDGDTVTGPVVTAPKVVTGYDLLSPMDDSGQLTIELTPH